MAYQKDFWEKLKEYTAARIALGRTGSSVPTDYLLQFQLAHAKARDAVYAKLTTELLQEELQKLSQQSIVVHSKALDRTTYLKRPDLGRQLNEESAEKLKALPSSAYDICFVLADGLSAFAVEQNALPLLKAVLPKLSAYSIAPICIALQSRVALGDEIAYLLNSRMVIILIGERPGLSAADSMGIYLTYQPKPGTTDERRNCISNIRLGGLHPTFAAEKALYLINESFRLKLSGVALKEDHKTFIEGKSS